jgi:hypothetical protein
MGLILGSAAAAKVSSIKRDSTRRGAAVMVTMTTSAAASPIGPTKPPPEMYRPSTDTATVLPCPHEERRNVRPLPQTAGSQSARPDVSRSPTWPW